MPAASIQQTKPTTILTGFLGAGKTTYLNHLLQTRSDTRFAIIENEYGTQGIDGDLIIRAEDGVIELNNGCLCCTLNDNLYDILNTLFDRRDEYDEIIIEATGVANPAGLAEPFIIHPAIKKQFPLRSIICIVDAELIFDQLKTTEEAISQITYSDILLINKIDLVSNSQLQSVKNKLQQLNPLATMVEGSKENFPQFEKGEYSTLSDKMPAKNQATKQNNFPVNKPHSHHHHDHTDDVVSQTFNFDQPFNKLVLHHQLLAYLTFQSAGLYRMKGLIYLSDSNVQHVIQSVGKRLDISEKRRWKLGEKKQSTIVFIGKNLQRKGLEKMLSRCIAKHTNSTK